MPKHTDMNFSDGLKIGDHLSGTTIRDGRVVGFSESEGRGRAAYADLAKTGQLSHGIKGAPSQNEGGTLETCRRLVTYLNRAGGQWILPAALTEGVDHVDCLVAATSCSDTLAIQVVRAQSNSSVWHELAKQGQHDRVADDVARAAAQIERSIALKAAAIDGAHRPKITLALNAEDTPALAFNDVVDAFRNTYGDAAHSLGFSSIWIVGPTSDFIHKLA